jgi:hypothetical protein
MNASEEHQPIEIKSKVGLKVGLLFAVPMSLFFMWSNGFVPGLIGGVISGILFGLILQLFVSSKSVNRQTKVEAEDLLPDEKIILIASANMVVSPKEFGLKKFAFDGLFWAVGMKNKESLGGKLYLTNYRLIFKTHKWNRLRGTTSIFLPTIQEVKNSSYAMTKKISVRTVAGKVEFIVNDADFFITHFNTQYNNLDQETINTITTAVKEYPQKCNSGLESWNSLNVINNLLLVGEKASDGVMLVTNPLGALGSIFMKELLDKTIADKWQKRFEK